VSIRRLIGVSFSFDLSCLLVDTVEYAAQMKQERDLFEKRCNELQKELEETKAESARVIEAVQKNRDKREEGLAAKLRVDTDSLICKLIPSLIW
jgi:hypothetical protein